MKLDSVTEFLKSKDSMFSEALEKEPPEFAPPKLESYHLFVKKTETYVKNAMRKAIVNYTY